MLHATITQAKYGSYTHGTPRYYDRTWARLDTYHTDSAPDLDGLQHRVWCVNGQDDSPRYSGRYEGKCSACWLNHSHTAAFHTHRMSA